MKTRDNNTSVPTFTPGPKKAVHRVIVTETERGWAVTRDGGPVYQFDTGAEALAAVKEHDALAAEQGTSTVSVITWEPTTRAGRLVVYALTGDRAVLRAARGER